MKIAAALVLTVTASSCSQPSEQENMDARSRAVEAAAEAMCRDGGRASALSVIAGEAQEAPQADIGQTVYETASEIERTGCAEIVMAKQADWEKYDAFMADVEASTKK